jgi:hypothetical protein
MPEEATKQLVFEEIVVCYLDLVALDMDKVTLTQISEAGTLLSNLRVKGLTPVIH